MKPHGAIFPRADVATSSLLLNLVIESNFYPASWHMIPNIPVLNASVTIGASMLGLEMIAGTRMKRFSGNIRSGS